MSDIYNLLNINLTRITDFQLQADLVIDHQTKKVFNKNLARLKEIENRILIDKGITIPKQSIEKVIIKVKNYAKENNTSLENWNLRELRIISYHLMQLRGNPDVYNYALKLLNSGWKYLFINGLFYNLLNFWNEFEHEYRDLICKLIQHKLKEYNGDNKKYNTMKKRCDLFDIAGPTRMAALLSSKRIKLTDAPTIFGYKRSSFSQSYYSDVILRHLTNFSNIDLEYIEEIFEYHKHDRTRKLVFAYLVEKENEDNNPIKRSQLCYFANRILGDISIASSWAPFSGASHNDAQRLRCAMETVNLWFTQQIIETFFEVCVQDPLRKNFWIKYLSYISGFKIAGSSAIKGLLQNNSKIGSMFLKYFVETDSKTAQTAALILYMKDKMIVEFSDTGALYVYNRKHDMVKLVNKPSRRITSTNDLKIPGMQMLIGTDYWGSNYYQNEGRMVHQGYWEDRLTGWIQKMVINSNVSYTFLNNSNNDDIFHATPII